MKHYDKSLKDNKHTSENEKGTGSNKEQTTDTFLAGESRRRFVKGTLAAAPVLMTVVSRPAWGNLCAPSGMVSGNLSSPGGGETCVLGKSPDYYAENVNNWPSGVEDGAYFDEVFEVVGSGPHIKLKNIIKNEEDGSWKYSDFERAAVAAWLNSLYLTSDYLNMDMVICMVHDVIIDSKYKVMAGHDWVEDQVLSYFTLTWTGPLP